MAADFELGLDWADAIARLHLARVVVSLLEKWDLTTHDQLALLGMSTVSQKTLIQYRHGKRALPNSRDMRDRVGYLLGIHKQLRLLFPEDSALRWSWVHRRNQIIEGRSPLQVMLDDGLEGLARVAHLLEDQRSQ